MFKINTCILFLIINLFGVLNPSFAQEGKIELTTPITNPVITYIDTQQGVVYLSNNTTWQINNQLYPDGIGNRFLGSWREGDRVYAGYGLLRRYRDRASWVLYNQDAGGGNLHSGNLIVTPFSFENLPHVVENDNGRKLILSDGTHWYIGWWSGLTTANWGIGEKILIFPEYDFHFGSNSHILLNVSRFYGGEKANATIVE